MRTSSILVAAALMIPTVAVADHPHATAYTCRLPGKPPIVLDITRHRFRMAGQTGELSEGLTFGFETRLGYGIAFNLGDPDTLRDNRPRRLTGTATVEKDGRMTKPMRAVCTLTQF